LNEPLEMPQPTQAAPPARLLFVRHGHRAGDKDENLLMVGQADLPLSAEGERQAEAVGRALAAEDLAAAYTSPLVRTVETARRVLGERPVPLSPCRGLLEIDCGAPDGLPLDLVRQRYRDQWEANERQDDDDFRWPGGESYAEMRRRVLAACDAIAARHRGDTVLVVSHAGVVNQVVGFLHGERAACWSRFRPGNCTVTEVLWRRGEGRVVRFADEIATQTSSEKPNSQGETAGRRGER
jgi:broad specificity phosphatase PhoE